MVAIFNKSNESFSEGLASSVTTSQSWSKTMKTLMTIGTVMTMWIMGTSAAWGQVDFNAGSDGSFGPIDITVNTTLDLPPDGIFNATTINVATGAILTFNRNPLNTPVYLLATGDITIAGTINVSGKSGTASPPLGGQAGPGGFDGGTPGFGVNVPPGDGFGPGRGLAASASASAGNAAYGAAAFNNVAADGNIYGSSLLIPLVGGSGGGGGVGSPGTGGGGGGGAILLASNTRVQVDTSGSITARGAGSGSFGNGSGGAIRMVAPIVAGGGSLVVTGGGNGFGGAGRIRIDAIDRTALQLRFSPLATTAIASLLVVFPDIIPRLDVVETAGQIIQVGQPDPVMVLLPFGSTTLRTVTVQATDFVGIVPIDIVLTPESGPSVIYPAEIDMSNGSPAQITVDVVVPVNSTTRVNAWTR